MHKNREFLFWKTDIRPAGDFIIVQLEADKPYFAQGPSYENLGFGILSPDPAHNHRSNGFGGYRCSAITNIFLDLYKHGVYAVL